MRMEVRAAQEPKQSQKQNDIAAGQDKELRDSTGLFRISPVKSVARACGKPMVSIITVIQDTA